MLRGLLACLLLAVLVWPLVSVPHGGAAFAQSAADAAPDYAAWEADAKAAEEALQNPRTRIEAFETLRTELAAWRAKFLDAQNANAGQIATVKDQLTALGPQPAEGSSDAPEIAERRKQLNDQLARLQTPGINAVEAHSRADSLIRQIDTEIRSRQASEMLRLFPSPVNPLNWPAGYAVASQGAKTLAAEVRDAWQSDVARKDFKDNLPAIIGTLLVAALLLLRGSNFIERISLRLQLGGSIRARNIAAALVSLGQVIVPVGGMVLVAAAIVMTGMVGTRMTALVQALPIAAFWFYVAQWIGSWLFRSDGSARNLTDRPLEARLHTNLIGLMLAVETFRRAFTTEVRPPLSMAAQSVWAAPLVCILAVFLFRLGMLLRAGVRDVGGVEFGARIQSLIANAVIAVSLLTPVLAVIGYVSAANALIWPTVATLGLLGLIIMLQRFGADIYIVLSKRGEDARDGLWPVLIGFILVILAIPLFSLIWGARVSDLSEAWTRFSAGIPLGQTRLSPGNILIFILIFVVGYMLTRLIQSALKSSVLPRTTMDKGVSNAIVSGVGYVGIFLAALVAITGAGIDLSSLAIVAGALSVGIGFGLQNIVQNFVSGIILLIERPISEGDMIEVNGQFGTVKGISVRSTWIETFDRTDVIVPNADLVSGVVTNLTRGNLTGRLIVPVGVAYGTDTRKVEAILQEIAEGQALVMVDPAPAVVFTGLGSDSLDFEIRMILSDVNFKLAVQTEVLHEIVEKFAEAGIEVPFAQRDIWIRNPETLVRNGKRPAPDRKEEKPVESADPPDDMPKMVRNDPSEDD